ncbi:hypothetical protein ACFYO0_25865 [Streptomyces sp. NPDC006365]|uniref:hypothetical protein n=1 Tax=Streptomyces sp. NPDC006365 TaxID=3364744 RepID=UPI0036C38D57
MSMHLDLTGIVLLVVGLLAAYTAHKWKEVIAPVTVGAIVVTLLVLLTQQPAPAPQKSCLATASATASCPPQTAP